MTLFVTAVLLLVVKVVTATHEEVRKAKVQMDS